MDHRALSDPRTARTVLAEAATVDGRMRANTRGYGVFVLVLAGFFPAVLLTLGFAPLDPQILAVGSGVVGALVGVGSAVVAARLTTVPRGFTPRYLTAFLTSAGLYTAAIFGSVLLTDSAAWWIGWAVLTAVPLLVLGWTILRGARCPAAPAQESDSTMRA